MKSRALTFMKTLSQNKIFLAALIILVCAVTANATTYTPGQGTAQNAEELDGFWNKVAAFCSGSGGKLLSLGVIISSVWERKVIGNLAMGLGVFLGIMIPTLPTFVDKFSYCI